MRNERGGKRPPISGSRSRQVLKTLKAIQIRAKKAGKGKQFLEALRAINDRLRNNPKGFGEPLYRLPSLKLVVYAAVLYPLAVHYGVHQEKPLVFLPWVRDMSY